MVSVRIAYLHYAKSYLPPKIFFSANASFSNKNIYMIYISRFPPLLNYLSSEWLLFPVAGDPCLGKQVRHFRFIFTSREGEVKMSRKCRSHLGPIPDERKALRILCETFANQSLKRSHLVNNN